MNPQFKVGEWLVDPGENKIARGEEVRRLEPKVMAVLDLLRQAAGESVSADELMRRIWPDTFVSETLVRRAISELRRMLDDNANRPRYVATLHKSGYRLIAPVIVLPRAETAMDPEPVTVSAKRRWVLAAVFGLVFCLGFVANLVLRSERRQGAELVPTFSCLSMRSFTGEEGFASEPAFSPDGRQLAYVLRRDPDAASVIYRQNLGDGEKHRVSTGFHDARSPCWSADGRALFFIARVDDQDHIFSREVQVQDSGLDDRSDPNSLVDSEGRLSDLCAAPDGKWLVYTAWRKDQPSALYRMELADGEPFPLTQPPARFTGDRQPAVSPDGTLVAFLRTASAGNEDVFLVRYDGGGVMRRTFLECSLDGLAWGVDGRSILVSAIQDERATLLDVAIEDGKVRTFLACSPQLCDPAFSKDGTILACQKLDLESEICRLNLAADLPSAHVFISSLQRNVAPQLAPNGKLLAFVSTRAGSPEIWTVTAEGSDLTQLTSNGGPVTSSPAWSPDSRQLAYESAIGGNGDIYLLSLQGGRDRRLTHSSSEDRLPAWSPDGECVFFTSNREAGWQIWRKTLQGGALRRMTIAGGFRAAVSEDGAYLYYTKHRTNGLWRLPVDGGKEEWILPIAEDQWGNWALSKRGVYYVCQPAGRVEIRFFAFERGADELVIRLDETPENASMAVSPDGHWLYFSRVMRRKGEIVLFSTR